MKKNEVDYKAKERMRLKVLDYERRKLKKEIGNDVVGWLMKKVDIDDENSVVHDSDFVKRFINGDFEDDNNIVYDSDFVIYFADSDFE